jgi:hypothetical protein
MAGHETTSGAMMLALVPSVTALISALLGRPDVRLAGPDPCLQHAERVSIAQAGHAMSFMNPAAFGAAVLAFLHGKWLLSARPR